MIKCSTEPYACFPICDYCQHYDFDNRYCNLKGGHKEPDDGCDQFHCYMAKDDEAKQK
jgi:hypothetical protein